MGQQVAYEVARITFYVKDEKVIEVTTPDATGTQRPNTVYAYDPKSHMLPEPHGYSAAMGAVAWSLTLYVDATTTQSRGLFTASSTTTRRLYPNPWFMAWEQRLRRADRARPLLRGNRPADQVKDAMQPLTAAVRRVYMYIAQMAYNAYVAKRSGDTSDADRHLDLYLDGGELIMSQDNQAAQAALVLAFVDDITSTLQDLGADAPS